MKKTKTKSFQLRSKKRSKPSSVSKVLSGKPSPRFEKFRWPVMVVKLRKGKKIIFETISNFNKILLKFKILIS